MALAVVAACGGGDGGDGGPTGNTGTIGVAVNPAALTLPQGGTGTVDITLTRGGGFSGTVGLAISGLPAGVTTTVTPTQLTGATTTAAVAVSVATTVAPGTYTATVRGTATGIGEATTTYTLTVTAAPDFALTATPAAMSIAQGANGTATVNIDRTNFNGAVTLSLDSPPAGITATFLPASSTTNASTMTVNVGAAVAPGSYAVTVRGTATGLADRTAQFTVNVAAPAFTIAIAPTALTIQQGNAGTATITIGRTNFAGAVSLLFDNPPPGLSGTFAPGATTGTTSTFTLNVAANTPVGMYNLSLRATAAGLVDRVLFFPVTVTAAPGGISLSLTPSAISLQQGTSGATTVNINRTNFTGDVALASSGAPGGVTIAFNPTPTTASTSAATITVGSGTPAGTYPIIITGTGAGLAAVTANLSLTVTTPGSGGNAEWQFCSAADTPVFFAYQDGTNAWQRVTPSTAGTVTKFAFNITAGRGGVAYITQSVSAGIAADASELSSHSKLTRGRALFEQRHRQAKRSRSTFARGAFATSYATEVFYGTATELTTVGADNCNDTQGTKTITGTVAGVSAGQYAQLSLGGASASYTGVGSPNVTFRDVANGTVDFVGTRATFGSTPDKVVLFRNLNIPDGGALPGVIDFAGAGAFAPATATATFTGGLGEELAINTLLTTANGESLGFSSDFAASTDPQRTWAGLPANQMVAGDVHGLFAYAQPAGSMSSDARIVLKFVGAVANQTIDLGPNVTEPTVTPLSVGAYPRFRFQGALPTEYRQAVGFTVMSFSGSANYVSISATGGYLSAVGSASTYDLVMPDLAGLNGFPAASRLDAGANTATMSAFGWNGTGILSLRARAGDVLRGATRSVTLNVP